jgi:2-dehydropantoate 2-reductase
MLRSRQAAAPVLRRKCISQGVRNHAHRHHGLGSRGRLFRGAACGRRERGDVHRARGASRGHARERAQGRESAGRPRAATGRATDDPRTIGAVDLVIVAVKLWDIEQAARQIEPLVRAGAAAISLQNGVAKDEVLRGVLGAASIMGGTCYIGASIVGPAAIRHIGQMQRIVFGEYDGRRSPRAEAFLSACQRAGIDVELSADIERAIWEKFVFLVAMSGATSTIRLPIGPIRQHPLTRAFFLDLMREVVAVGRARGVKLGEDFPESRMPAADALPPEMTSSMHNDLKQGNRLEVPWLAGSVVELGAKLGLPTPLNRAVRDILTLHAGGKAGTA